MCPILCTFLALDPPPSPAFPAQLSPANGSASSSGVTLAGNLWRGRGLRVFARPLRRSGHRLINHAHGWMTKHSHLLTAATSRHVSCDVWHVSATDVRSTDRRRTCWGYLAKDVSCCTDGPPDSSASATEELLARAPPALHQRPVLVGSRRSDPNVACPIRGDGRDG
jgi:hypothetical protein